MSYNITNIDIVTSEGAYFETASFNKLKEELGIDEIPEVNFFNYLVHASPDDSKVPITNLYWCGERSGDGYEVFKNKIVPHIKGEILAIVTWEGGDAIRIWHIKNGMLRFVDLLMWLRSRAGTPDKLTNLIENIFSGEAP